MFHDEVPLRVYMNVLNASELRTIYVWIINIDVSVCSIPWFIQNVNEKRRVHEENTQ